MSIVLNGLTKIYGTQKAIDSISFSIKSGEIVGFLGPNGAGKSTTMKILSGFIPPTEGKAYVLEKDVELEALEVKKRIGYLPELNPLYTDMYVLEYLQFNADIFKLKEPKKDIARVIKATGLEVEKKKKINQLSKGYKQRVGLAQALLNDPDVLILDEPTSGLDPNQMTDIRQLILSLGKDKTILLSSHIMQEVEAMCSRVIIINNGKIVADDHVQAIKEKLKGKEKTIKVKFRDAIDDTKLKKLEGVDKVISTTDQSYLVTASNETDIAARLFNFAIESDTIILEQQEQIESLENIFQQLTQNA